MHVPNSKSLCCTYQLSGLQERNPLRTSLQESADSQVSISLKHWSNLKVFPYMMTCNPALVMQDMDQFYPQKEAKEWRVNVICNGNDSRRAKYRGA